MSNQVYSNSRASYAPQRVLDTYTLQASFTVPGSTAPTWAGGVMGVNKCNGVNGVAAGGVTTYETSQYKSNQRSYYAKNVAASENGGTVFYILEAGTYQFYATVCWNTPGASHWRGLGIRVTPPGASALPLIDVKTEYTSGAPTEGFSQSCQAQLALDAGAQVRVIILSDESVDTLVADRGAQTQIIVGKISV